MAFLHDPDVILLDEPGNSLDEAGLSLLRSAIDDVRRADKCVVWCAPTLGHVDMSFDREYELVDGKVIAL
jgi:ABC-type multidrug transport system ATPase subunit